MSTKGAFLVAAGLLIVAFGIGVWVGRSTPQRKLPGVMQNANTQRNVEVAHELATCQEELAEQAKPRITASAQAPEDAKSAAVEPIATAQALEEELKQCKKSEIFIRVDLCLAPDRYAFPLLLPVLEADQKCVDNLGVGDLIVKHSEQCARFEDQTDPEEMDLGELSHKEVSNLYRVKHFGRARGDFSANIARGMTRMIRQCRKRSGMTDE